MNEQTLILTLGLDWDIYYGVPEILMPLFLIKIKSIIRCLMCCSFCLYILIKCLAQRTFYYITKLMMRIYEPLECYNIKHLYYQSGCDLQYLYEIIVILKYTYTFHDNASIKTCHQLLSIQFQFLLISSSETQLMKRKISSQFVTFVTYVFTLDGENV